jgi:hypothetical protein
MHCKDKTLNISYRHLKSLNTIITDSLFLLITLFFVANDTIVRCLSFVSCAGLRAGRLEAAAIKYSKYKLLKKKKQITDK